MIRTASNAFRKRDASVPSVGRRVSLAGENSCAQNARMGRTCLATCLRVVGVVFFAGCIAAQAVVVTVDVTQDRQAISPLIYGINYLTDPFGTVSSVTITDLNASFVRNGGNLASRYNWQINAENHAQDFYFESIASDGAAATDQRASDLFITTVRNGGAEPTVTIPTIDWLSNVGAGGSKLASFSMAKYGPQTGSDSMYFPDAGNGLVDVGGNVTHKIITNNKSDASVPNSVAFEMGFLDYLQVHPAGFAAVRYYTMDNEPDLWADTHRDVVRPDGGYAGGPINPINEGDKSIASVTRLVNYARLVKQRAPGAIVLAPETSSWFGYLVSAFDRQYANNLNAYGSYPLDGDWLGGYRTITPANPDGFYLPWLLGQLAAVAPTEGRLVDYFTLHYYPQTVSLNSDASLGTANLRNRSTRSLWDPTYFDEDAVGNHSYINAQIRLIPRMKEWVVRNYPGTKIGITEYNWGADQDINGGTALADVLGIFGREGLDLATVFPTPNAFAASGFKMYRNYDGQHSAFGETRVRLTPVPDPNLFGFYAAQRASDGRLTLMLINKGTSAQATQVNLTGFVATGTAGLWRLGISSSVIQSLAPSNVTLTTSQLSITLPAQSVTLAVLTPTSAGLFAQWQGAHFTPAHVADPNTGGWLADPDHDGIPNWLAFVCNVPPLGGMTAADRDALPQAGRERNANVDYVTITYRRNVLAGQTIISYETSADLSIPAWQPTVPDLVDSLIPDAFTGDPRVRAKFVLNGARKFVRLRATGP